MLESAMTRAGNLLRAAASLRVTPFALLALAGGALLDYRAPESPAVWMAVPLAVLAVNLGAALLVDPRLRLRAPLLLFHVALLVVLLLACAAELLRYSGQLELVDGAAFDADAVQQETAGPLYRQHWMRAVDFTQQGFSVEFQPGLAPGRTRSRVTTTVDGVVEVGNTQPLVAAGYRFHTTSNKGFAAIVRWQGRNGVEVGSVHFPSWPLRDWRQLAQWTPAGGESLELELQVPLRADALRGFVLDSHSAVQAVSMRVLDARGNTLATLLPGASVDLADGRMTLIDLRMWMGYRVGFDPLLPWLLATALLGVAALGAHLWSRFSLAAAMPQGQPQPGDARHA